MDIKNTDELQTHERHWSRSMVWCRQLSAICVQEGEVIFFPKGQAFAVFSALRLSYVSPSFTHQGKEGLTDK